ncbi:MAG: hypothetical protein FWD49_00340 [Firmicutes bacterium]|nr:hypothetical protein [Bacillota bacterium]
MLTRDFNYRRITQKLLTGETLCLIAKICEVKGELSGLKIDSDIRAHFHTLSKTQSARAISKLSQIPVCSQRIDSGCLAKRGECDLRACGAKRYYDALSSICESYNFVQLGAGDIIQLYESSRVSSDIFLDGGLRADNLAPSKKTHDSDIAHLTYVLPPVQISSALEMLTRACDGALATKDIHPLLFIPAFLVDFLHISPFAYENGNMSRLLAMLLLLKSGYDIGLYVSLASMLEKSKTAYYNALKEASLNWQGGNNDYMPFVKYILNLLYDAYQDFKQSLATISSSSSSSSSSSKLRRLFEATPFRLTKKLIALKLPNLSVSTIEQALHTLLADGFIVKIGSGKTTAYAMAQNRITV